MSKSPSRGEKTKCKEKETQRANQGRTGKSLPPYYNPPISSKQDALNRRINQSPKASLPASPAPQYELTNPLKLPSPPPPLHSIKAIRRFQGGLRRRCVQRVPARACDKVPRCFCIHPRLLWCLVGFRGPGTTERAAASFSRGVFLTQGSNSRLLLGRPSFPLSQLGSPCLYGVCALSRFCCGRRSATPYTVARLAPLSVGLLQATVLEWAALPSSGAYITHAFKSATTSQASKGKAIRICVCSTCGNHRARGSCFPVKVASVSVPTHERVHTFVLTFTSFL